MSAVRRDSWDEIGGYAYEGGYCVRDAFRRHFGDSPILSWFPYDCPIERIKEFCRVHGYPCEFGRFSRKFNVGQPVVWIRARDGLTTIGHATYCRDPRKVVNSQQRGDLIIAGYVLLEQKGVKMSNVTSKPMTDGRTGGQTAGANPPPSIGFIPPGQIERGFIVLLYLAVFLLVILSILGTLYGLQGKSVPLARPGQIWADITDAPSLLVAALIIQGALMLMQYGARQFAKKDRRWWLLYLVALGVSMYYNVQAYWQPLVLLLPGYAAAVLILAGDVLPEFIAVRRE